MFVRVSPVNLFLLHQSSGGGCVENANGCVRNIWLTLSTLTTTIAVVQSPPKSRLTPTIIVMVYLFIYMSVFMGNRDTTESTDAL
jgi:hypothetical protein